MTMSRRTHRILTVTATVALLAAVPGLTGVASADDGNANSNAVPRLSRAVLTDVQTAAVANARTSYVTATTASRASLKSTLDAIWASITSETTTPRDAAVAAAGAYRAAREAGLDSTVLKAAAETAETAYRLAVTTATSARQADIDAAKATARTTDGAARAAYVRALTEAFTGTTVPQWLLDAPRSGSRHGDAGSWFANGHDNREFGRNGGNGHHGMKH